MDMWDPKLSRRAMLGTTASLAASSIVLLACGKKGPPKCTDTSGLSAADATNRQTLAYVEPAPDANKQCQKCQQFVPGPSEDQCGSCKVLKGPVSPVGYCKVFAPKA